MKITTPQWMRDAVFYSIFPDRFAKSARVVKDRLNLEPWDAEPTSHGFKGGDLLGILEHLDHIQGLGVNAIYLTPIFTSPSNHHYHTLDYYTVDPLFGGNAAFRELLDEVHRRGMHLLLDGVFNHASRGFYPFNQTLENGKGSPYVDWFFFNSEMLEGRKPFNPYPGAVQMARVIKAQNSLEEYGYLGWYHLPALPKFNTGNPEAREFLLGVAEHWARFGIDGWRIDVAKEIDDDAFYQEFRARVKAINPDLYITGELWQESQRWLSGDQFDGSMNYLLNAAMMGFFIKNLTHEIFDAGDFNKFLVPLNAEQFAARLDHLLDIYDPAINEVMMNHLDTADMPRFITSARGDQTAYDMALLFEFTFVGAPCIYYGDEIGLEGRNDPECRRAFPWERSKWNLRRLEETKTLIALRNGHAALRRGTFSVLHAADGCLAYLREGAGERLIAVFNVNDDGRSFELDLPANAAERLFGEGSASMGGGRLRVDIPGRRGMMLELT